MPALIRTIFLFSLIIFADRSAAQDTVMLFQKPGWDSTYNMEEYARYYVDENNKEQPDSILQRQFVSDTNFFNTIRQRYGRKPVNAWVRWIIHNPLPNNEEVLLLFNRVSFISFYYEDEKGLHFIKNNRSFITSEPKNERRSM